MSTFKFACSSCGQHIVCDKEQAGAHMECPRCFQNIVVPQAPEEESKFVLTAAKVQNRIIPTSPGLAPTAPAKNKFPYAMVGFIALLCGALIGGFVFRDKLFKHTPQETSPAEDTEAQAPAPPAPATPPEPLPRPTLPVTADTNWTMNLTNIVLPKTMVVGRINGLEFTNTRAYLVGGTLTFRQGNRWPPELGLGVQLNALRGEDLANKSIKLAPEQFKKMEVALHWKDPGLPDQRQSITNGYALRVDFGPVVNGKVSGRIYLCTPDDYKSWIAGTFTASIRKPRPSDGP